MSSFKIYNTSYTLRSETDREPDAYGYHNELVDDQPAKGKFVGYVTMEDGSVIECYKGFNPATILVPVIVLLVIATGVFIYFRFFKSADIELPKGLPISKTKEDDEDEDIVITYNGFMAIRDGQLTVHFQNGSEEAHIEIKADGVNVDPIDIKPDDYVDSIPATYDTDEGVVPGTISISTNTSETSQDIVIEIPDNNTTDSPEGFEGYWKGEYVYGTGAEEPESE